MQNSNFGSKDDYLENIRRDFGFTADYSLDVDAYMKIH